VHIIRINFYSGTQTLVKVGNDDDDVRRSGGRIESVDIAADEQLIGAELYHGDCFGNGQDRLHGMTWLKCKIAK
jgi:hypothetical protein